MRTLLPVLLLTGVLAAGCGGDDEPTTGEPTQTPAASASAATTADQETSDLPPSTIDDWTGLLTEAAEPNGWDYNIQQLTDAVRCLPTTTEPTCALAAMSGGFMAEAVASSFSGALGEGDLLSQTDPIGEPPAEIADLVDSTLTTAEAYDEAMKTVTGVSGGPDCSQSDKGTCAAARDDAAAAAQAFLDTLDEWEPYLA